MYIHSDLTLVRIVQAAFHGGLVVVAEVQEGQSVILVALHRGCAAFGVVDPLLNRYRQVDVVILQDLQDAQVQVFSHGQEFAVGAAVHITVQRDAVAVPQDFFETHPGRTLGEPWVALNQAPQVDQ